MIRVAIDVTDCRLAGCVQSQRIRREERGANMVESKRVRPNSPENDTPARADVKCGPSGK